MRYTFLILALFFGLFATSAQVRKKSARSFVLKGIVVEDDTNKPIAKVNVETDDGEYTTTNAGGQFSISAEIGD